MNGIFVVLFILSALLLTVISPERAISAMIEGGESAVKLTLKLAAIYAVWLSVLKIIEATKLDKLLSRALAPLTKRLFKNESDKAREYISVNLASNLLGLGGAATPAGICAIREMDKSTGKATKNMVMLTVLSATSIQLIPVTVMAMMSAAGSTSPSAIILPSLISTAISTSVGALMVAVFVK